MQAPWRQRLVVTQVFVAQRGFTFLGDRFCLHESVRAQLFVSLPKSFWRTSTAGAIQKPEKRPRFIGKIRYHGFGQAFTSHPWLEPSSSRHGRRVLTRIPSLSGIPKRTGKQPLPTATLLPRSPGFFIPPALPHSNLLIVGRRWGI